MPPKVSDQKRKRGRPPGASKVEQDASNSKSPVTNDEPDAEEEARPRKRGRKPNAEKLNTAADLAARDGSAPPAKRGRPPKTSEPTSTRDAEAQSERQEKDTGRQPGGSLNKRISTSKGKPKDSQSHGTQAGEGASSSEPRRSGRERRSWNPDEIFGSNSTTSADHKIPYRGQKDGSRKATGATKDNTEVVQSRGKGKAVQSKESRAEDEPSGALPRRRTREHPEPTNRAQISPDEGVSSKTQKQGRGAAKGQDTLPKRGRPALGREDSGEGRALQPQQGNRTKAPGKASKQAQHSEGHGTQPRRRGRPKASGGPSPASGQDQPSDARAPARGRPPKPREDQGEAAPKAARKQAQPRRLETLSEEAESSEPEEESELPFRYLKEATKNVPRSTISDKWNPLDGPSINAVGAFLADAQRPVLLRLQDTNRRREHASSALSMVSRRLRSKLVKGFPFPAPTAGAPTRAGSGSYEDEFDFERTVDAIQALENALNPLQHSVALLEREIRREEDALAKDYDSLHKLEANARSEAKRWREQARREHVLAPGVKRKGEGGDEEPRDSLELVPRSEDDGPGGLFEALQDEELVTISKQIGSHMESMKGNLQQIGGVVPAIAKSKAALQQVLLRHLDDEQYERVLIG